MSNLNQSVDPDLDEEWVSLIQEAREMELSIEEVKEFFKTKQIL